MPIIRMADWNPGNIGNLIISICAYPGNIGNPRISGYPGNVRNMIFVHVCDFYQKDARQNFT